MSIILDGTTGIITGNAVTTSLSGGSIGTIPYQSSAGVTAMLAVGTAGQILVSNAGAAPSWITTLPIANGGTNSTATPTAGGVGYGTSTAHAYTAAGTSGNALISAGASAPAFGNLALGTANTNVSGTLTVTNGGTGVATLSGVAFGNGTSAFTAATAAQIVSAISTTAVTNATNATTSTNIAGQTTNGVLYQSASGTTTSTAASTAAGQVLTTTTLGGVPSWQSVTATTATNLASGSIGTIPYQSAAGTTAMLAVGTAGQVLTSNAGAAPTWSTPSSGFTNIQVYTTTTTWTIPAGVTKCKVTVVAGGGAGVAGGGGGAGGTAIKYVTGLVPAGTVVCTVGGAGGASSFGANCSATAGAAGGGFGAFGGGLGGVGSSGSINIYGIDGERGLVNYSSGGGCYPTNYNYDPGQGGSSGYGSGGLPGLTAGAAARGYGSGGGGGISSGGAGTGGIIIIEY